MNASNTMQNGSQDGRLEKQESQLIDYKLFSRWKGPEQSHSFDTSFLYIKQSPNGDTVPHIANITMIVVDGLSWAAKNKNSTIG